MVNSKSQGDEHWGRLVGMSFAFMVLATSYLFLVLCVSVRLVDGGGPWFVFGHALEDGELFDATRNAVAFATFTIAGAAAYLAYRRQRATDHTNELTRSRHDRDELGELRARFTTAVEQLAHSSATVRIAGVYSLAAVADQWLDRDDRDQAQVAVDVLCGYLRLPYSPSLGANHQTKRVVKSGDTEADSATEEHFEYPQNDRVVRETVCSVIASKIRGREVFRDLMVGMIRLKVAPSASPGPWSDLRFDFVGAHLVNADFEACHFSQLVSFAGAQFEGKASFRVTRFEHAIFDRSEFASADFSYASCADGLSFKKTKFQHTASFNDATFDRVTFVSAEFSKSLWFKGTTFNSTLFFAGVKVAGLLDFSKASFEGGASFRACQTGTVKFAGARITKPLNINECWALPQFERIPVMWGDDGADFSEVTWLEGKPDPSTITLTAGQPT